MVDPVANALPQAEANDGWRQAGWKRSMATEAGGTPPGWVVAAANAHDSPLLGPTLDMLDNVGPLPDLGRLPLVGGGAADLLAALGLAEPAPRRGRPVVAT